ncbi:hypothetical protein [Umezawaea sp. NPDC059074]|uniref:hypothetical protein n=1 Tax=Umezawaea sp. NPDC059074 TaxID=3346716 RepID=UPI00368CBBD8
MTDSTSNGPQQPQPPAEIDPEQLRQFQEFQRFQDYQRFQQAREGHAPLALPPGDTGPASQPPAVQPPIQTVYVKPAPKPMWQIILGSKLVRWLVMLLILALLGGYAYNRWFGGDDPGDIAVDSGGNKGNVIAPTNAYGLQGTVGIFYKHVSQGSDSRACNLFADDGRARQKFATAFSAPDCQAAIRSLHDQVSNVSDYEQVYFADTMLKEPLTNTTTVSSCKDLTVVGGPRLGKFVLTKQSGSGAWIITDYEAEPAGCPAVDSGGNKGNVIAPVNAYGLQGTVGTFYKHVSQGSSAQACALFTGDGRAKQKFAAAFSAPDCEAAVTALHGQVTNVSDYEQPLFPDRMLKEPTTSVTEVSSCKDLTVSGGPRLGKFVLSYQDNKTWLISDYAAETAAC